MVQEVGVKFSYMYKVSVGHVLSDKFYHIISVSVDNGDDGFNCWGFELKNELEAGQEVTYNPNWMSAGEAIDAALVDWNKHHSSLKVNSR